jgi:hypothetical protein
VETAWSARLQITHAHGRCRLSLGRYAYGDGDTLQDAGDALVARLLAMAIGWRDGGFRFPMELGPQEVPWFEFLTSSVRLRPRAVTFASACSAARQTRIRLPEPGAACEGRWAA